MAAERTTRSSQGGDVFFQQLQRLQTVTPCINEIHIMDVYILNMLKYFAEIYGGFRSHGGTPSHHPSIEIAFSMINLPFLDTLIS